MNSSTDIWDLMDSCGMAESFMGAWCEGLSVGEVAERLRVDPGSMIECSWEDIENGLGPDVMLGGAVWIGSQGPGWTQIVQLGGLHIASIGPQASLSAMEGVYFI